MIQPQHTAATLAPSVFSLIRTMHTIVYDYEVWAYDMNKSVGKGCWWIMDDKVLWGLIEFNVNHKIFTNLSYLNGHSSSTSSYDWLAKLLTKYPNTTCAYGVHCHNKYIIPTHLNPIFKIIFIVRFHKSSSCKSVQTLC